MLQALDTAHGSITVGRCAEIIALESKTPGAGNVDIVVGSIPTNPVAGKAPAGVNVKQREGGRVFFGQNGIVAVRKGISLNAIGSN